MEWAQQTLRTELYGKREEVEIFHLTSPLSDQFSEKLSEGAEIHGPCPPNSVTALQN